MLLAGPAAPEVCTAVAAGALFTVVAVAVVGGAKVVHDRCQAQGGCTVFPSSNATTATPATTPAADAAAPIVVGVPVAAPITGQPVEARGKEEAEHTKGKRPSTKSKHQKGKARKRADKSGEKKDKNMPYRKH